MNGKLEDITGLTSSHMEKRGVKLIQSAPTPFDDPESNLPSSSNIGTNLKKNIPPEPQDLHTIRYNKGVLLPRSAEDQTQVEIDKHTTTDKQSTLIQDVEESFISEHTTTTITSNTYRLEQVEPDPNTEYALVQKKPSLSSPNPESKDEENDEDLTYKKLGRKLQILTEKMESAARDLNDRPDIPFIDSEDTETRLGAQLDLNLESLLSENLDLGMKVEKIQLETSERGHSSASIVVAHRKCRGTDTVHMSTKTLQREYSDI
ncbi:uncharacterized protein LOC111715104 [Eurytemora carolleeae]|uniref:uncharacterized protein LOC111715104 n=1 Tax=Eurytemora carolleeae TaxID=1294199 RepID=UPI000C787431|nr:uncharacterized protein LOC111715104 [Eurytemora carolleeae]|eukprot:XP_023346124.1 uncharacterized protein LOC111715104 [Eurytemora affinis]